MIKFYKVVNIYRSKQKLAILIDGKLSAQLLSYRTSQLNQLVQLLRNLTHILPCLPPTLSGVGDYCVKLWKYWPESQPSWSFLVTEGALASQKQWPKVRIVEFEKSTTGLISSLEAIDAQTVVLHYAGYGFHPKGCPIYLPKALKEWKAVNTSRRVVIMFHELYATGAIWSSSFWVKPLAQKIIRDLILLADLWLTNCSRYRSKLIHNSAANPRKGALIPIGANILPVEAVNFDRPWPLFTGDKLKVIIFGLAKTRLWTLNVHAKLLRSLCERGWVERITLAGSSGLDVKATREMAQRRAYIGHAHLWHEAFDLTASQASQLLATQDLGLVSNEPDVLTKSGVFAALSVHGVLSLLRSQIDMEQGDLDKRVFLYNTNSNLISKCLEKMQNEQEVYQKKQALQTLMQTELNWQTITLAWVEHLEQMNSL